MIKLVKTLKAENDMPYMNIMSFKTANYIGIWNHIAEEWVLLRVSDTELYLARIPECGSFEELDDKVFYDCEEHIEFVSDRSDYEIVLNRE